jgi:hypothetical protein
MNPLQKRVAFYQSDVKTVLVYSSGLSIQVLMNG